MQSKKLLTIVTGMIGIVSFVLVLILPQASKTYDLILALFGSAALGCFMSLAEYYVARREAMEDFYNEVIKLWQQLWDLPTVDINIPMNLFKKVLLENWNNESARLLGLPEKTEAREKLRDWYMSLHPICADCMIEGRSVPATELHHKRPFSTGKTEEERMELLLNPDNLVALCSECHDKRHFILNHS